MRQFYYKTGQLLQIATNLLQIATVHLCIIISTFSVVICENTVKQIISERMNEHVKIKLFCFRYFKKNVQKKCFLKFR